MYSDLATFLKILLFGYYAIDEQEYFFWILENSLQASDLAPYIRILNGNEGVHLECDENLTKFNTLQSYILQLFILYLALAVWNNS